jgi:hypothetical protein
MSLDKIEVIHGAPLNKKGESCPGYPVAIAVTVNGKVIAVGVTYNNLPEDFNAPELKSSGSGMYSIDDYEQCDSCTFKLLFHNYIVYKGIQLYFAVDNVTFKYNSVNTHYIYKNHPSKIAYVISSDSGADHPERSP